jgi:hypothetical protein
MMIQINLQGPDGEVIHSIGEEIDLLSPEHDEHRGALSVLGNSALVTVFLSPRPHATVEPDTVWP